ncbi:hypothetical protein [Runella sp. SP2]|uniref:hypothetical protein n=1 Tax=Runella sp. SP2 TaxID=2268026 RepID=UPI000F0991FD|nr:hypothetical protein [Runella sp. SP2]AYQ31430.1 hypothetical protein DTQ70_04200 [Runella sp. SP2]
MKAIEEIERWFETEIYYEGVQLYQKYGTNDYLKKFFNDGTERHRRALLSTELKELLEQLQLEAQQKAEARPSELQLLLREAGSLMDERTALKERARQLIERKLDTPQELGEIVLEIMQRITPRLDEIFGLRDFYEANGYLPETAALAVQSISDLYTRRNTLRTYLSRTAVKGSAKRQLWLNELFAIEQKLKGLKDAISNE